MVMLGAYLASRKSRDLGWVDIGWTLGVGAAAVLIGLASDGVVWRRLLIAVMCVGWAGRLAGHILRRTTHQGEDARYRSLRAHWGDQVNGKSLILFLSESVLVSLFAIPILVAVGNPNPDLGPWDVLGVLIWLTALGGEALADRQLDRFRENPANRGKTCRHGLWYYSRHPNYFFEWLHWFVYLMLAVGAPHGGWAWMGPMLMFFFLFRVTGIPFAEKQALARRGEDYRRYQQATSVFLPWFPRKEGLP